MHGVKIFDDSSTQRLLTAAYLEAHKEVVACMAEQGFEFHEPPPTYEIVGYTKESDGLADDEYARRFGFGIAPVRLLDFQNSDLSFEEGNRLADEKLAATRQYESTLSSAELAAYDKALSGTDGSPGCNQLYYEMVEKEFQAFLAVVDEVNNALHAYVLDVTVVDHYQPWTECMLAGGQRRFTSPLDAYLYYRDVSGEASRTIDMEGLAAIAADEVEAAVMSVSCGESTRNYYEPELEGVWESYSVGLD